MPADVEEDKPGRKRLLSPLTTAQDRVISLGYVGHHLILMTTSRDQNSYSQHLQNFHVAAEDAIRLGAEFDAHGAAGGADHQAVYQIGLAVIADVGRHLLVGCVIALHLHVDFI